MADNAPMMSRKLVLLGESSVGKSSVALRFCKNAFDDYRESTIGAAFLTQTCRAAGQVIKYEIWDTAGQERYASLAPMYYRGANSAIVVYDISSSASLIKAKTWISQLARQADSNIVICLAGNKLDLAQTQRQVTQDEAQKYAQEEGLLWFECSAKTGEGVEEIFLAIANKLILDAPPPVAGGVKSRTGAAGRGSAGLDLSGNANGTCSYPACAC